MKVIKILSRLLILVLTFSCSNNHSQIDYSQIDYSKLRSYLIQGDVAQIKIVNGKTAEVYIQKDSLKHDRHRNATKKGDEPQYILKIESEGDFLSKVENIQDIPVISERVNIGFEEESNWFRDFFIAWLLPLIMSISFAVLLYYLFLRLTIHVILKNLKPRWIIEQIEDLLNKYNNRNVQLGDLIETFPVKSGNKIVLVPMEKIIDFTIINNYLFLTEIDDNEYLIECSLKDLENKLPDNFIRVHRATIINKNMIKEINKLQDGRYDLVMIDKKSKVISCSKNYNENIKNLLKV